MADDVVRFHAIDKIREMWSQGTLTNGELIELTQHNAILFIDLILEFPYHLSPIQEYILDTFYNPENKYRELVLICGRKAGKTDICSALVLFQVYRALQIPNLHKRFNLVHNKPIYAILAGPSKDEVLGVAYGTIRSLVEASPYLRNLAVNFRDGAGEIKLPKNIVIHCQTSSARSTRGFANIVNLYDEQAHFFDTKGNLSADEIYEANNPNLDPLYPISKSLILTSPAGKQGKTWELFKTGMPLRVMDKTPEHGQHAWRAVFQYATWEMNPAPWAQLDSELMQSELKRNPDKFWMERGARFCDTVDAALPAEKVLACAKRIQISLAPTHFDKVTARVVTLDPALTGDSYGLAMGHKEGDVVIVDLVKYWEAPDRSHPISPTEVEAFIRFLHVHFRLTHVVADQFESYSTCERLRREGIPMHRIHATSQYNQPAYESLTRRIITETIEYPKHTRTLNELTFLQRKVTSNRTRYEAAVGYSDDIADCLARLVYTLETERPLVPHVGRGK